MLATLQHYLKHLLYTLVGALFFIKNIILRALRKPKSCTFCGTFKTPRTHYQDEHIWICDDIKPDATIHLLVISKQHIAYEHELTREHGTLLQHMQQRAIQVLQSLTQDKHADQGATFGFHRVRKNWFSWQVCFFQYPFCSIDHLHMHVLHGAFVSSIHKISFTEGTWWFQPLHQILKRIQ